VKSLDIADQFEPTSLPILNKVLVAEDDRISQLFMLTFFKHYGVEVKLASTGRETLQTWQEWQPDLILMDMRMPELNGLEATQIIRQAIDRSARTSAHLSFPVIIAITASAFAEDWEMLLTAGCNECLEKPLYPAQLNRVLSHYFNVEALPVRS
jgi:two-component system sensor histidine kinase/response regulator